MARAKNRDKIIQTATHLFNEQGFVNVRLQHISDASIISLGNIAYHFKNKGAILEAIYEQWEQEQRNVLIEYRHAPIFENLERIFESVAQLQATYRFFYTDLLEVKRTFPELFERLSQFFQWQVLLFQDVIRFNIARGAFQPLSQSKISFLANLLLQQLTTLPYSRLVWPEASPSTSDQLWRILEPYLTPIGEDELEVVRRQTIRWEEE